MVVVSAAGAAFAAPDNHHPRHKAARVANAPGLRQLASEEIRARLIGNTVAGAEDGEAYAEYLSPTGIVYGRSASGRYLGAWRIEGAKICFRYGSEDEENPKVTEWNCNPVTLSGRSIYWSDDADNGDPAEATLMSGNAKEL
jgi:hypothetical protein